MFGHRSFVLLVASTISLTAAPAIAPAFAMRSHDVVPALHKPASQILFAQAQAPGRPVTQQQQTTTQAPQQPARDPVVRVEPPSPTQPRNPFPQRPANEPRPTNPLSR
jgi:hypothetical protein